MKRTSRVRAQITDIPGEKYRFHASSDTFGAYPWLVDLEAHGGLGECACPDFQIARRKKRKEGETNEMLILCKHQKRCLIHWALREIRKQIQEAKALNKNKPSYAPFNTHA